MAVTPPPQAEPVKRPHFVQPHESVDVEHGSVDRMVEVRIRLMHGANHNDPAHWAPTPYDVRRRQR
jgi:cyanobactin biosynthesis protein (PatB/AcyB/McaB family)